MLWGVPVLSIVEVTIVAHIDNTHKKDISYLTPAEHLKVNKAIKSLLPLNHIMTMGQNNDPDYDAVVVGAGFSGIRTLWELGHLGLA